MNKQNKLDIYYECFDKVYSNKSIEPLVPMLCGLVICYEEGIREGKYTTLFMMEDSINDLRIQYVHNLIILFTRIVSENKQNKVYDTVRLLLYLGRNASNVTSGLKALFYPQEFCIEDSYQYHSVLREITSEYIYNSSKYNKIDAKYFNVLENDFIEILNYYKEYLKNIKPKNMDEVDHKTKFTGYMNVVMAYYYKEKYDVNVFPKIVDYVFNHVEELEEFNKLNNPDYKYAFEDVYINKIMESCTKEVPVIK